MTMVSEHLPATVPDVTVDPATMYERPFDVLSDMTLTRLEKIAILHRWLTDVVHSAEAAERRSERICAVTKALQFLGAPVRSA